MRGSVRRSGRILGDLGDPRFDRCRGPYGDYLRPPLVAIEAATYRIGSDEGTRRRMRPACRETVAALRPSQVASDFDHLLRSLANPGDRHVPIAAL